MRPELDATLTAAQHVNLLAKERLDSVCSGAEPAAMSAALDLALQTQLLTITALAALVCDCEQDIATYRADLGEAARRTRTPLSRRLSRAWTEPNAVPNGLRAASHGPVPWLAPAATPGAPSTASAR